MLKTHIFIIETQGRQIFLTKGGTRSEHYDTAQIAVSCSQIPVQNNSFKHHAHTIVTANRNANSKLVIVVQ